MEFFLIVGHDPLDAVFVEVSGHLGQGKARLGELEQGPVEQGAVVGLKMNLPALPKHPTVAPQEALMGEAAAGVLHRWPGIAKVDIDEVYLPETTLRELAAFFKEHAQMDVVQIVGNPDMKAKKVSVLVGGGSLGSETALAAAQFQPQEGCIRLVCTPTPLFRRGVLY